MVQTIFSDLDPIKLKSSNQIAFKECMFRNFLMNSETTHGIVKVKTEMLNTRTE